MRLRSRFLSCFYCGKRSTIKFDGHMREFPCSNCDATNYLDQNGEITDPPALEPSSPKQFATTRATSPPSPADDVFCQTCLKNQRLFTASLAQYLPDDPSDPEYAELERKYFRFRKDLETRYPQVCADCADEVEKRLRQARYTAQTDYLRRMVEISRGRKAPKRTTALDLIDTVGRWLWWGGLLAQMLWHLVRVARALEEQHHQSGLHDPDERIMSRVTMAWLSRAAGLAPDADRLVMWSITAGFLSAWWNPHFVAVNRGFSRHLVGFAQWYSFQGLIILLRYLFRAVMAMKGGKGQSRPAQLSAHLAMAAITGFIYYLARRSITVEAAPLFGPPEKPLVPPASQAQAPRQRIEEEPTLAEALTAVLDSPAKQAHATPRRMRQDVLATPRVPNTPFRASRDSAMSSVRSISPIKRSAHKISQQDPDEMDWSPIPSKSVHRAFQEPTPGTKFGSRPFGQSPTQPGANPFWFKVPAAPVNPAQRLRNPPNVPFLRTKQEPEERPRFSSRHRDDDDNDDDAGPRSQEDGVSFRQPSFFAPEQADEANALADVFSQSFSLEQETGDESEYGDADGVESEPLPSCRQSSLALCMVAALLPAWLVMSWVLTVVPYRQELQLASLGVAGIVAVRSVGAEQGMMKTTRGMAGIVAAVLGAMELGAIGWAFWEMWTGQEPVPWYGSGTLGLMLGHQAWRYFL